MRAILTYHSIDSSGSTISVDVGALRRHLEWLAAADVDVLSVPDLLASDSGRNAVALTFDDAFDTFGSIAWPMLRDLGLPATLFVVTEHVGQSNRWGGVDQEGIPTRELLDWDEIGRLAEAGVHIGSHTRTHPKLSEVDPERLVEEVSGAAEDLKARLGFTPDGLAYPYGDVNEAVEAVVAENHKWACTTHMALLPEGPTLTRLPRLDAYYYRGAGQLEAWGTTTFRARLGMRRAAREARQWVARRRPS